VVSVPRIYICVKDFHAETHDGGCETPVDFCRRCAGEADAESIKEALENMGFRLTVENVQEQFEIAGGFENDHPPYEEEDYKCDLCGELLDEYDN
jgi:hypothetical protein